MYLYTFICWAHGSLGSLDARPRGASGYWWIPSSFFQQKTYFGNKVKIPKHFSKNNSFINEQMTFSNKIINVL